MPSLETLLAYLPQDRRESLATGGQLPQRSQGAALWADLSGFTPLTETLARKLGVRRGAEELALHLNRFYDALIAPVEAYGGSVIDFSGDAINCWFEADDGRRALTAAQAMQAAMQPFTSLQLPGGDIVSVGVKIAIVSGPMRRFLTGDPAIQLLDTLAGATMERLTGLGHLAATGEVLVDEATETQLQARLQTIEWRVSTETGQRAAVVGSLAIQVEPSPQAALPTLAEAQLRPWLLPAVFARLQGGQGEFLTELRPAAALFMRFDGLDYEGDEQAGDKLDVLIRRVQHILAEYEGTLLQLTLGDKGSYLYAVFGAPLAHENDLARAVSAAIELTKLPNQLESIHSVCIGLSRGTMRTGAYGSMSRRTYGVLGDEVNLAARLMQRAASGQVLVSQTVWQAAPDFRWEALPAFEVKGKRTLVIPAALLGRQKQEAFHLPQGMSDLPMVGRQAELALIEEKLALARQGRGQIISITGEAGMGKSRLLAEVLQRVLANQITHYGGECQSYGTQSSYLVWHAIWRAFFGLDPTGPTAEQIETLEKALTQINPDFLLRLPLLSAVLNLSIPDNRLTGGMDAKSRKTSRESLLVDCLRARAGQPLVLILEDVHWIDPLSRDLLELIGRAIKELPVLILLAYRPPHRPDIVPVGYTVTGAEAESAAFLPNLKNLEYAAEVRLTELIPVEIEQLVAARLAHLGLDGATPAVLMERIAARAQGNPFYTEELLNYLHDKGLDPRLDESWSQADLPDSLHSLILSRIDQLSERQQITIKAASIIGRLFRVAWLHEYYPPLGDLSQVSADLELLNRLELVARETPEPELAYLFKHVITQEVAYESLAYTTRASLHEQFARYLELAAGQDLGPFLDLLAYHYERSLNLPKKREYLRKAGEAAQKAFANEAALSYLGRTLALAPDDDYVEHFVLLIEREEVLDILGKREAQIQDLTTLAALAEVLDDNTRRAEATLKQSRYALITGDYLSAISIAQQAVGFAHKASADQFEVRGYLALAQALMQQSNYAEARIYTNHALALAETAKLTGLTAVALQLHGNLDAYESNYESAETYLKRALDFSRESGSRRDEAANLHNLGEIAYLQDDLVKAQVYYEQALYSNRIMGSRPSEGNTLKRLGNLIAQQRGDYEKAKFYCGQALSILQETGDRRGILTTLHSLGYIDLLQNNYMVAQTYTQQALHICREIGHRYFERASLKQLGSIADELGRYASALEYHHQGLAILRETGNRDAMSEILTALGIVFYHMSKYDVAKENHQQALLIAQETKNRSGEIHILVLLGHVLRELGDLNQASDSYRQALSLALGLGLPVCYAKQAQTGLACIALAQGNLAEAQAPIDEILNYLESTYLSTIDEIFWIYLSCYRILQANADLRAGATLNAAYHLLQEIAARIDDETLRASFLQNVRFNREIIQAWESLSQL
jgi:predicted ATPase/class 3 adenylate cyclase